MKQSKGLYTHFKEWLTEQYLVKQTTGQNLHFEEQKINLEPIFQIQNQQFHSALLEGARHPSKEQIVSHLEEGINHITYWHCHSRAIQCSIVIPMRFLVDPILFSQFEKLIIESELPVGFVKIVVDEITTTPHKKSYEYLMKLQRLGVTLEFFNFSGAKDQFEWLQTPLFEGVHIAPPFLRAASQATFSTELLNQLITNSKGKFHLYGGGISLVHDFVFAHKNQLDFCYGPLLMPCVSKHQILKIKQSQLPMHITSSLPPINSNHKEK